MKGRGREEGNQVENGRVGKEIKLLANTSDHI